MIIFTDGSSRGNPGRGGWGAIVFGNEQVTELGGREENTTNNRMELLAVISALEFGGEKEITIFTDSAYIVSGITRWIAGWKRNNWKTSTKDDVLNRDLWERLDVLTAKKIIDWRLVKGHSGNLGNERCDVIATSFADDNPTDLYVGPKEKYDIHPSAENSLSTTQKPKTKGRGYSYISSVDGVIQVHRTWEECKKRVHGVSSAKFKKSFSPENEEEIINEFTR